MGSGCVFRTCGQSFAPRRPEDVIADMAWLYSFFIFICGQPCDFLRGAAKHSSFIARLKERAALYGELAESSDVYCDLQPHVAEVAARYSLAVLFAYAETVMD